MPKSFYVYETVDENNSFIKKFDLDEIFKILEIDGYTLVGYDNETVLTDPCSIYYENSQSFNLGESTVALYRHDEFVSFVECNKVTQNTFVFQKGGIYIKYYEISKNLKVFL